MRFGTLYSLVSANFSNVSQSSFVLSRLKQSLSPSNAADVSSPLFHTLLPLYALLLLPTFHHLWLYSGSGNANFFYASTLVWAVSQGGWALEFMQARGKREVGLALTKEGREKVRQGKWAIVQR